MSYAKHVGQPPALDAANMVKDGTKAAQAFPAWKRWVGGEGEFDGKGLRDVVEANAGGLDRVKADVDQIAAGYLELRADVEALKEAPPVRPFP